MARDKRTEEKGGGRSEKGRERENGEDGRELRRMEEVGEGIGKGDGKRGKGDEDGRGLGKRRKEEK